MVLTLVGVRTTRDAPLITYVLAAIYLALQLLLLVLAVRTLTLDPRPLHS